MSAIETVVVSPLIALQADQVAGITAARDAPNAVAVNSAQGLRTAAYHAGLRASERRRVHEAFLNGGFDSGLDVVVATSAFGMGSDKPNVRFVVQAAIPESIDAYHQEIGRAGRPATAALHYRSEDLGLRTFSTSGTPDRNGLARAFAATDAPMRVSDLGRTLTLSMRRATGLVNLLEEAGVEAAEARERIEHSRSEDDRITVFFEEEGYQVLSREAIREHDLLAAG